MKLLQDILVIDFSQFLSGPSASLCLADFGADVIKIEKPGTGDICRELYVSDVMIDGESSIFHAINRNKKSYAADLKNAADVARLKQLIQKADVVMHNFRPGVMERLGFDYDSVKKINPNVIYAQISGYGEDGPWKHLPGQDLLLQSLSGLAWLNNSSHANPTPMGVSVVDMLAGAHVAQGIMALLYRKGVTGEGGSIQVSMLESALDFQFEVLTCYFNDGGQLPQRSAVNSGHAYVAAPYGIYKTKDDYIALAMADILQLGDLIGCDDLAAFTDRKDWFEKRDEIKTCLAHHLLHHTTTHWLEILEPAGVWCSKVLDYEQLTSEEGYQALNMEVVVKTSNGISVKTTRCPVRVDGELLVNERGAPALGEHNSEIDELFEIASKKEIVDLNSSI
ncbi:CaiB/BaiF CoA transferase family protein [Niabella insulamsoli]|uniref:CaiB/BaiF CoA transferase family protein n=1 Tax=Niabella insulamsoli TaxID=3144874 RepID=UPI0031FE0A5A